MTANRQQLPLITIIKWCGLGLVFLVSALGYVWSSSPVGVAETMVQGELVLESLEPVATFPGSIQPGKPVKIKLILSNRGQAVTPAGEAIVQYGFGKPLEDHIESVIFQTEKAPVSPIEPGASVEITFKTPHQLPSIYDFVRNDWSMREYQAVLQFGNSKTIVAILPLTFSAYYYPGVKKHISASIPVETK